MNDFMRRIILSVVLLAFILSLAVPYGCTNKKPEQTDSIQSDSAVTDTTGEDSTENLISQTPMPKTADELFDDFVFNFAANRKLQLKRIVFPLPVYRNGKLEKKIEKGHWRMEHFFMHQDYYTLILDNEKQVKLAKDTTIDHVVVEKIFFHLKTVQQFLFNRIKGKWMLTSINYKPMYQNDNASFLKFYQHFAVDSAFQMRSMAEEVKFSGPDPTNDMATMTGIIMPQQWPDFKPGILPSGTIYNIIYGQTYKETNYKVLMIRGIANSNEVVYVFRRFGKRWKLVKFSC
jgi:hypothetical protein